MYQFVKSFLDKKMSIFEEYGAFKPVLRTYAVSQKYIAAYEEA